MKSPIPSKSVGKSFNKHLNKSWMNYRLWLSQNDHNAKLLSFQFPGNFWTIFIFPIHFILMLLLYENLIFRLIKKLFPSTIFPKKNFSFFFFTTIKKKQIFFLYIWWRNMKSKHITYNLVFLGKTAWDKWRISDLTL